MQLSWTASAEAQSYNIYSGTGTTLIESGVTTTSTTFTGLAQGTTLYYSVRSVAYGTVGGPSNEVAATPTAPTPAPSGGGGGGSGGGGSSDWLSIGLLASLAVLRLRPHTRITLRLLQSSPAA